MKPEVGDAELMEAIGAANHRAFQELVHRYSRQGYRLCYRLLGEKEMAEDVVQEVMLKIWLRPWMWRADKGVKFSTWLYRVISNAAIDAYRRKRNTIPIKDEVVPTVEGGVVAPDWDVATRVVRQAINDLPENQRLAIILSRLELMSYEEVAAVMQVTSKAVDGYINRGMRGLKKRLKEREIDIEGILR